MDAADFLSKETSDSMDFTEIINSLEVKTPFGRQVKAKMQPFIYGMEEDLRKEFERISAFSEFRRDNLPFARSLDTYLDHFKDIRRSVQMAAAGSVLDEVELFEIKAFMLNIEESAKLIRLVRYSLPDDMLLDPLPELLDKFDLSGGRTNSFFIEDAYSQQLTAIREEIRDCERQLYAVNKCTRERIKEMVGLAPRSSGEIMIGKQDLDMIAKMDACPDLALVSSTFTNLTYKLTNSDESLVLEGKIERLKEEEDREEFKIREMLSDLTGKYSDRLFKNMMGIGLIDLTLSKSRLLERWKAVIPEIITGEPYVKLVAGRHPVVENNLRRKHREYVPVSIELKKGVSVITGANMGGKTVSLKTVAVITALAQFGLPVPAAELVFSLFNFVFFSGGDHQSVDEGLSTFGAEIQRLQGVLPERNGRGLLCLDELARGTNPHEGYAIASALLRFMNSSESITIVTTHFEGLAKDTRYNQWQVRGLKNADFTNIEQRIAREGRGRMELLHEYMDYRLERIESDHALPKDALNVARLMGMDPLLLTMAESELEGKQE